MQPKSRGASAKLEEILLVPGTSIWRTTGQILDIFLISLLPLVRLSSK